MKKFENFIHDKTGWCYYSIEPNKKAWIYNLYTEHGYRGKGYARKHLTYVINEIRQAGYTGEICIEPKTTDSKTDIERLTKFYSSFGLTIVTQ